ncbi:putative aminopeptidase [Terriglobus roseus DSM 18391]|uniref:Putative aminopeptidase n=1 Tax=Terriglobus roseus (strain DSM 18391 / NRRL B-41598 / KBS 63) TaxID=926566 RepID=I3ZB98_TERRK|nr:M20/M25/M40 family metallo-hydrolase [Terriglobus roseus]AFL86516.1 putative aminopeptidase [Terriglobus roseus DSM 18391]
MRRILSLAAAALLVTSLHAQKPDPALAAHVRADMDFLASDELHGRGSLTRDEHLAAQYCATVFEGLGLKPAGDNGTYLQKIPVDLSNMGPRSKQRLAVYEDAPRTETWNAIAILPGTDPKLKDEVILLTAHLDHLGVLKTPVNGDAVNNGADDDASGTTAVLNLARELAAGKAPKRTVVFALFGSEEMGGYGARGFLAKPPVPLTSLVANLEFEMIGRPDPLVPNGTLWLTGYERSNLGPELAKHGAKIVADPHPKENFFMRSDNIALARKGIIAQTVSSFGLHTDYHHVTDELKTIDFPYMTSAIAGMESSIHWLTDTNWKPDWLPNGKPDPNPPAPTTPRPAAPVPAANQ